MGRKRLRRSVAPEDGAVAVADFGLHMRMLRFFATRCPMVKLALHAGELDLGVRGARHPLALYCAGGVPVVLATDDEGVSRSDMTNEYLRAATEQGLRYRELRDVARASLEYAFLPGASLWQDGAMGARATSCRDARAEIAPKGGCAELLAASDKAREQWRLEEDFAAFERTIVTQKF